MSYFLTSDRLGWRHWRDEDLPLAMALWTDPGVMHYLDGPYTPERVRARLADEQARQREFGVQYWPVFELATGGHVGVCGLRPYGTEPGVLEIGAHIGRRFWSERMGEEAARTVIAYAFETLQAKALMAGHHPENQHSEDLIRRLGFVYAQHEPWGMQGRLHPFYRLNRPA